MPLEDAMALGRFSDRISFLYEEHAHIDRDAGAAVITRHDEELHVPAAMLGALLLGPGTRISHAAASLLTANGTSLAWVGEEGVRFYAGAISTSRSSALLLRQAFLVSREKARLGVARAMYSQRFPGEDVSRLPMQKLLGREGARMRACYRDHALRTGVAWDGRKYDPSDWRKANPINRAISSANAALYGVVHSAIHHLGCSAGLGFIHTGHQLAFVYDVADLYKAEFTIPAAFDCAANGPDNIGTRARRLLRDRIVEHDLLPRIAADIKALLLPDTGGEESNIDLDSVELSIWTIDGKRVPGGTNYQGTS